MSKSTFDKFEDLFDERELKSARSRAETTFRDFTSDELHMFKRRMKNDLFFLCTTLGYDVLSPDLHGDYCTWIQKNRGYQKTLELLPRGHFKSTIRTIGDSIQMALPNVDDVLTEHPYTLGPNIKLLLMHEVRDKAADFLFEITQAFMRNEAILALFPECIPTRQAHRINRLELELPRDVFHREATFETLGTGSASQGGHYHWFKLDDLFGEEARDSESVRARLLRQFDGLGSLFTRRKFDGWNLVGTRWGFNDVYYHALKRYKIKIKGSVLNCFSKNEIEKFSDGTLMVYGRSIREKGRIIFPEEITEEAIAEMMLNPVDFAAQQLNNPVEGGLLEFPWPLKWYNVNARDNRELIIFSDLGSRRVRVRDLDICVFCDPSMGESEYADETGIVVTGIDSSSNIYILETVKKRLIPPDLIDEIFRLFFKYQPRVIAIEEVNFSAIYKYWINEKSHRNRQYLPIHSYKPGSKRSKEARIRGLSHFFSAGQVYVAENMLDFREEYDQFPLGESKHLLDALAQGPDFWKKGFVKREDVKNLNEKINMLNESRSALTGY